MTRILKEKLNYLLFLIVCFGINGAVLAQDDAGDAEEEETCWCKYTEVSSGVLTIINVDSMVANTRTYRNSTGCDCADCDEKECDFERREHNGVKFEWVSKTGECVTEIYGEGDPWDKDTTEVKDSAEVVIYGGRAAEEDEEASCDCIQKRVTNNYTTYQNMSAREENQRPLDPADRTTFNQVRILRECDDADCGSGDCTFAVYKYAVAHGVLYQTGQYIGTGICTDQFTLETDTLILDTLGARNMVTDLEGNDVPVDLSLSFYPNPASDQLKIIGPAGTKTTIFSLSGEILLESEEQFLNIENLSPGMYVVFLESNKGVVSRQLVIQ
ncbi:MAG: hypothetical protein ACI8ZM_001611 [Crocinitomix sp.]|jgi:hypothetical protein